MDKEKILKVIQNAIIESGGEEFDLTSDNDIEILFNNIVQSLDLPFNYYLRNGNEDYWTQIEYYSNKIRKTIIWDYDAGNYDDYDELADAILNLKREIDEFEEKLPVLN